MRTLAAWLSHIEALHAKPIDMGLERMREMVKRMRIAFSVPVITVAGTNGKGSTCAMLESIYRAGGFRTGMHTSPHLMRFNERCLIDGREVPDEMLCRAFAEVEAARGDMTLSYFEFTALGILKLFEESNLDVVILEIGLGGRLDAINTIDPDVSVISTIGIDHTAYLGTTREAIGWEKAHIFRPGRPAVCSDPVPPRSVLDYAAEIGAKLLCAGRDFSVERMEDGRFSFACGSVRFSSLPAPALPGENQYRNAAGVLAAVASLMDRLPVGRDALARGLRDVRVTARFELVTQTPCPTVLDVGHNPEAAAALAKNIADTKKPGEATLAVFGMLADKDMARVAGTLCGAFSHWFIASLTGPRAATADQLKTKMLEAGIDEAAITAFDTIAQALEAARNEARSVQNRPVRIVVFGSFVTVTAALACLAREGVVR